VARLYEYQGKELLKTRKIPIPRGGVASTPQEAKEIAEKLDCPVVIKAQAWVTGRAALGGIKFAASPQEAQQCAADILGRKFKGVTVEKVLVEEKLDIEREFFASIIIDDQKRGPVAIFSSKGGTGIEEIARQYPSQIAFRQINVFSGLRDYQARNLVRQTGLTGGLQLKVGTVLTRLYQLARQYEARSAELNPLVVTRSGDVIAADCRIAIDDYAVFRHPELGIEIARELDRPATPLEKIAYKVEEGDFRGTFYFIQLTEDFNKDEGYIGFHGAGGGGSMMSMDALLKRGYKLANFCDTSGNPPASKVYRAAKIILSQSNIDGYFASGSGVASQEQFHSARGLVKAFLEENLSIPAVIRLGGNSEEKAIEIIQTYTKDLHAPVEGYGRDDTPDFCVSRLEKLLSKHKVKPSPPAAQSKGSPQGDLYSFDTLTGTLRIDHSQCLACQSKVCVKECIPKILKIEGEKAVLAITTEEAKKGGCIECLACELACRFHGNQAISILLPIPELEDYRRERML